MTVASAEQATPSIWVRVGELALAAGAYFVLARGSLLFASLNASATRQGRGAIVTITLPRA